MRYSYLLPLVPALASAFLIPPNLEAAVTKAGDLVESGLQSLGLDPFKQVVKLDCPGCAYKIADESGIQLYAQASNSLLLEFTGNPNVPHDLKVNGHDIFRLTEKSALPVSVKQVLNDNGESNDQSVSIGFELFIQEVARGIRNVRMHVIFVDGMRTARTMDIVEMTVFADERGVLYIAKAESRAPTASEASAAECRMNLVCRWKAYFSDKIHSIASSAGPRKGGCHGKKPHNGTSPHGHFGGHRNGTHRGGPHHGEHHEGPHHGDYEHEHNGTHHGYHGHGHRHFWLRTILKFAVAPIVLGTIAGILVSFLGVFVGHIVIGVYRLATGKPLCARRQQQVALVAEEEEGLLKEDLTQEGLPAYTEAEVVVVSDKKTEL